MNPKLKAVIGTVCAVVFVGVVFTAGYFVKYNSQIKKDREAF